jgi:hypothetical protein
VLYADDIILPQAMLTLMATTSLLVPRDSLGERLGITLTMVLASIAFKSTVNASTPEIAYLTLVDLYILINFGFLIVLLIADLAFLFLPQADAALDASGIGNGWGLDSQPGLSPSTLDALLFFATLIVLLNVDLLFAAYLWLLHEANEQWLNNELASSGAMLQSSTRTSRTVRRYPSRRATVRPHATAA